MERFRLRRSKATSVTEGNRQIQKQKTVPKSTSDCSSRSSGTTAEDLFTFELAQSSSKRVTGTPIKKLLAEEMSKETESKRRPPSVIARLMGLDGLPPQQPVHKQQKGFSDNYPQTTASIGFQSNDRLYECRSSRKSSMEQQEFKDVYEVLETSKVESGRYPSKGTANSKLTEAEMAFVRQKFIDAKRLSTDEKLLGSKEFCDTLETLDSNKELLLKFLQQPDSLFTKHLLDLQNSAPKSQCSKIAVTRPSNYAKYESNDIGWKLERETSLKCDSSSYRKHQDRHFSRSYDNLGAHNSLRSSKIRLEGKAETDVLPARIVVLKPNLGNMQNSTKSISSPHSHAYLSDCRKHKEYPSIGNGEAGSRVKKNLYSDVGFSRPKSRESREIAKEITRRMRDTLCSEPINLSSIIRGYAGDESSYDMSGSDSASESEVTMLTCRNSFDWSNRQKLSSSPSIESSVSREAKKRLSQRWEMTHRYQDVGVVGKGSTLGEMLAVPDREMRTENLDAMIGLDGPSDRSASIEETAGWDSPLGISSGDGWKDGCVRTLSRRSIPASFAGCGDPKTSMQGEVLDDGRYLMPKKDMNRGRNKAVKVNLNEKEGLLSRNLRSSNRKSQSFCHTYRESTDSLQELDFSQFQIERNPSEQRSMVSEMPANNGTDTSLIIDAVTDAEHVNLTISLESPNELLPKPSTSMLEGGNSSCCGVEVSNSQESSIGPARQGPVSLQCPILEPQSPTSSKEADHPSPVSVLEVPFTDDVSSGPECFERVSANLHELQVHAKGPMRTSTNGDADQGFDAVSEGNGIFVAGSWESSYLVDVLLDPCFNDTDPDTFMATWYSLECPLGPGIFDNLEKKYCDEKTWLKSERRLLFDRINSGLLEIYQRFTDPHPWVKPMTRRVASKWQKDGVKNKLYKLLASQEKSANESKTEVVLEAESQWLDLGADIDVIGNGN
ncbi:hypothetical protein F0562_017018 [Nyssa sinensis]|uniref:DUF3741 domain-containing protein n=1 Tax=Nyssa sinensis TaxID=561372 RepID=A0A5J4ZFH6_9ASTE|nr:hypothetical protein F0562_017018 [Nyssa sinensis]